MTRAIALAAALLLVSCKTPTPAARPIDWPDETAWSLHVVTHDADGDPRVTRVWFVAFEGDGAIRTGNSRWWADIERGSEVFVRSRGVDYPVRVEVVTDAGIRERIDERFLEKYGWQESLLQPEDRFASDDPYMRLSPR